MKKVMIAHAKTFYWFYPLVGQMIEVKEEEGSPHLYRLLNTPRNQKLLQAKGLMHLLKHLETGQMGLSIRHTTDRLPSRNNEAVQLLQTKL